MVGGGDFLPLPPPTLDPTMRLSLANEMVVNVRQAEARNELALLNLLCYTVIPWYLKGIGSRSPADTRIHRCSSIEDGAVQRAPGLPWWPHGKESACQ